MEKIKKIITIGDLTNAGFIQVSNSSFIFESKKLEGLLIYNFENKKIAFYDYKNTSILPGSFKTMQSIKRIIKGIFNESLVL